MGETSCKFACVPFLPWCFLPPAGEIEKSADWQEGRLTHIAASHRLSQSISPPPIMMAFVDEISAWLEQYPPWTPIAVVLAALILTILALLHHSGLFHNPDVKAGHPPMKGDMVLAYKVRHFMMILICHLK